VNDSQLVRRLAILERIAEISLVLNSTLELRPLLAYLMDAAAAVADAEAASVLLWDARTAALVFTATTTSSAALNLVGQPVPLDGSIAGTVMREQRIVQVDDVERDTRHYRSVDRATDFRTRSILAVPLMSKDRLIGVLEILNKRVLPWTADDHHYVSTLAAQAAVAIRSAQLVAELQRANAELSELDRLKNDFIAIASHELRTPLGVILGYASFLQETSSGEVNEHATKVVNSALQLRRIIEDMTNLRYLKQRDPQPVRAPVRLAALLQAVGDDMLELCSAEGHRLEIILPPADLLVDVDESWISMALTNVLNNAVRFTPPGGRITVASSVPNAAEAWVTVTDTGIGLAPDALERVFEEFFQVEHHMTRRRGGLGIGLSIARGLVEAHGGRIWASSPGLGQGATFTLALPLAGAPPAPAL